MGYVLRVRAASFFAGASTASFLGLYVLHNDYKMRGLHDSLDRRISALEKLKRKEDLQPAQAPE